MSKKTVLLQVALFPTFVFLGAAKIEAEVPEFDGVYVGLGDGSYVRMEPTPVFDGYVMYEKDGQRYHVQRNWNNGGSGPVRIFENYMPDETALYNMSDIKSVYIKSFDERIEAIGSVLNVQDILYGSYGWDTFIKLNRDFVPTYNFHGPADCVWPIGDLDVKSKADGTQEIFLGDKNYDRVFTATNRTVRGAGTCIEVPDALLAGLFVQTVRIGAGGPSPQWYFISAASSSTSDAFQNGKEIGQTESGIAFDEVLEDNEGIATDQYALPFADGEYAADARMCAPMDPSAVNAAIEEHGDKAWDMGLTLLEGFMYFPEMPCGISSVRRTSNYSYSATASCFVSEVGEYQERTFNFTKISGNNFSIGANDFKLCSELKAVSGETSPSTEASEEKTAALLGRYGYDPQSLQADCEVGAVEVFESRIQYYDSGCVFSSPVTTNATQHISGATCEGEGQTWSDTVSLRLLDQNTLEVHSRDSQTATNYYRCPTPEPIE